MARAFLTRTLLASAIALAEPCKDSADGIVCKLQPWLTTLYVVAGVLALVLLVAILVAVYQYRRNKNIELKPE
ncbi:hypothetical protein ACFQBQ_02700 [Granulicella cerasi]|uniref:Uncharacterized protein n=1 Tax=Granulicella cerasi TaxID=741063 RepID=A0ABW1Z5U9_9BACT|nr:hypothetical protein [Granulicella cerasi]